MTQNEVDAISSNNYVSISSAFEGIAKRLDNKRLFKQALEGWQILMNLVELDPANRQREPKGWSSHPAVKMWKGSEHLLSLYIHTMLKEWLNRGFKTTLLGKLMSTYNHAMSLGRIGNKVPLWMLNKTMMSRIAASHRLALLSKYYEYYNQFSWPEDTGTKPESYDYVWPIKGGKDELAQRTEQTV